MNIEELRKYKPQIEQLAMENGISNIPIFGSVARGDETEDSDIDLLVDVRKNIALDFFGFHLDVEDILNKKVDFTTENAINRHIKEYVMLEAVPL